MRIPNCNCVICGLPIYRRPSQIKKSVVYCEKHWKTHCTSSAAKSGSTQSRELYITRWKNGKENGMRGETAISAHIRHYLFEKYHCSCCKCGWNKVHPKTKKVPLEVNHIDGNHKNNKEVNLELLCPNCHSLTENYRSLNTGNGRKR